MNWLKYAIIIVLFFLFSLLQSSFFPYFAVGGATPNLVFALFFVLIFFEDSRSYTEGFLVVILAGIFLDIFLPFYFGVSIVALLLIYLLHKFFMHFFAQGREKYLVFYFIGMFSASFIMYYAVLYVASLLFHAALSVGIHFLTGWVYSLVFACAGFYLGRKVFSDNFNSQLRLL